MIDPSRLLLFVILSLTLAGVPSVHAQPSPKEIESQLKSADDAERRKAVAAVLHIAAEQPELLAEELGKWLKPLMDGGEFEAIERVTPVAILHRPHAFSLVADAQAARVEALLAQGKYEPALVEAKRYYNIAPLKKSDAAIDLLAEALRHTRERTEPGIVTRFRRQQVAGATPPPQHDAAAGQPAYLDAGPVSAAAGELGTNVLRSIQADGAAYEAAIEQLSGRGDYESMMGLGNLLLLADRPAEAKAVFRQLAEMESTRGKNLTAAIEGVARAIRAEDGAVGRANAFVMALQQAGE